MTGPRFESSQPVRTFMAWVALTTLLICVQLARTQPAAGWQNPLPWEYNESKSSLVARPKSTREVLELYGIGDEQFRKFTKSDRFSDEEQRVLWRILFRLPALSSRGFAAAVHSAWSPGELHGEPSKYRGESFAVRGRVRQVVRESMPDNAVLKTEFDHYFRVVMELPESEFTAVVVARHVPAAWLRESALDEPARADGLFIKSHSVANSQELVFVASRVGWFPEQVDRGGRLLAGHVGLASLGMDIGLFDDVRGSNRQALIDQDRECFYELLAAVERGPDVIREFATEPLRIAELLQHPERNHGRLAQVRGSVRRVTKILIDDPHVRDRLNLESYYQLDVFVPLGNQLVKFGRADALAKPTFSDRFPITVCTSTLPAGMTEGDQPNQEIQVAAVFLKLWAYRSQFVSSVDERQRQLSPMLVGAEPLLVPRPTSGWLPITLGFAFLLILILIWFVVWRSNLGDKHFAKTVLRR